MKRVILILILLTSFINIAAETQTELCKVIFNIEGEILEFDITVGDAIGSVKEPVKEGYEFVGWFKNGILYDFSMPITEDTELIAGFKEIKQEEIIEEKDDEGNLILGIILIGIGASAIPLLYYFKKKNKIEF